MKLQFRSTLLFLLVVLVITSIFLVGMFSYLNARSSADDLADQVLEQTSDRIEQQIGKLLDTATAQAALTERMLASGQLQAQDFPGIIAYWKYALEVSPDITSFYIGLEATGECTGVSRLRQGKFTVWESRRSPRKDALELREYWLKDYPRTPYAYSPAKPAPDIRTRPWYAAARAAHRPIWTETFHFLGLESIRKVYGVTYAVPFYKQDRLAGVVSVDFDLDSLNRFLKTLHVGRKGFSFVMEERADGTHPVIAGPELPGQQQDGGASAERMDGRVKAFEREIPDNLTAAAQGPTTIRYSYKDADYIGRYRLLRGNPTPRWLICTVLPEAEVMDRVYRNNRNAILLGILILALAVLISYYVSMQVARPLERIARETQRIGQLEVEPRPVAHSIVLEVDRLAEATEEMKCSLRSFMKYVPADLVRSILHSGQEARLGGECRNVTVFFSDIANFTSITEAMSPEQLVEYLGQYLSAQSQPILETGGTVDKYIGDAIMAFWGAPERHPAHAVAACTAALRCQAILAEMRRAWKAEDKPLFYARIGINTGEVVVGNFGSAARLNYTVIGDAVNVASRLEGLNKFFDSEILISASTYEAAKTVIAARPLEWVSVKGKNDAVLVYELLGFQRDLDQARADLIGLSTQMLEAYRARDWSRTILVAEQLLKVKEGDRNALWLINRSREYQAHPPVGDWDGVHRMENK